MNIVSMSIPGTVIPSLTVGKRIRDRFWNGELPFDLHYIRVYERAPTLKDNDALQVLWDAIAGGDPSSVDEVIRDIGIVGQWRPSTIEITAQHIGTNRIIVDRSIAHALWNQRFNFTLTRGDGIGIVIDNDEDRERWIRVEMLGEPWNPERVQEYQRARGLL